MICGEARPLCGTYALELLDGDPRAELERHLQGCIECWEACTALRRVTGAIGYAAPPVVVPLGLKERLFIRLDQLTPVPPPAVALPSVSPAPVATRAAVLRIGLVGLLIMAILAWGLGEHVRAVRERDLLQTRLAATVALRNRAVARLARLDQQARMVAAGRAADVRAATLQGGRYMPLARARLVWQLREQCWLISAESLTPPTAGRVYVLWAMTGATSVNLGVLGPVPATGPILAKVFLPGLPVKPVAAMVTVEANSLAVKPGGDVALLGLL